MSPDNTTFFPTLSSLNKNLSVWSTGGKDKSSLSSSNASGVSAIPSPYSNRDKSF